MPLGVVRNTARSGVRFRSGWCSILLGVVTMPLGVVGDTARSGVRYCSEWCSIPFGVVLIPLGVVLIPARSGVRFLPDEGFWCLSGRKSTFCQRASNVPPWPASCAHYTRVHG